MNKLFIISNESIYENDNKFFCDNIDLKSTPEGLNKHFKINLIARKSAKERTHKINLENINIFKTFFSFISAVIASTKYKNAKYLIISISPFTFFACMFLRLFGKSPIVYLRSDGYGEYKAILGFFGVSIYHLMFSITTSISNLISCQNYILKGKKGYIVSPSQLDHEWFNNRVNTNIEKFKLLYVGRIRVEKGIFSLLKIIKNKEDITLTIVGAETNSTQIINQKNVAVLQNESDKLNLIKYYDNHNIFVLPSFTEGHPMVLLEALARKRPVVIFDDIEHVIGKKKGIFVAKRNYESFSEKINYIKNNYQNIQDEMNLNQLPTNKNFINEMQSLIEKLNA